MNKEENNQASSSSEKIAVLVVDDNLDAAEMMALVLDCEGYNVRTAHSGTKALEVAREINPAAIFLDIGLPDMSGYEVGKQLRADPLFSKTLLIALTGFGDDSAKDKTKDSGFDEHLTKPADLDVVVSLLKKLNLKKQ